MIIHPDDMFLVKEYYWPQVQFYDKQVQVVESVCCDNETYVVAGNKLGKDFIAGFIVLTAFIICKHRGATCRIVTTSVDEKHLDIMWGEIGRFADTAAQPVIASKGGPFVLNHMEIRRKEEMHVKIPYNYAKGLVFSDPEKMAGHHADWTLIIGDEASGLPNVVRDRAQGWAKRMMWIGNPEQCTNFFKENVKAGDLVAI